MIDTVYLQALEIDLIDADVAHDGAPFGRPVEVAEDAPVEMVGVPEVRVLGMTGEVELGRFHKGAPGRVDVGAEG